jgi:hypothetical protein
MATSGLEGLKTMMNVKLSVLQLVLTLSISTRVTSPHVRSTVTAPYWNTPSIAVARPV